MGTISPYTPLVEFFSKPKFSMIRHFSITLLLAYIFKSGKYYFVVILSLPKPVKQRIKALKNIQVCFFMFIFKNEFCK